MSPRILLAATLLAAAVGIGCTRAAIPDPRETARELAEAVRRGDAEAVHALLSSDARRALGPDGTRELLRDTRKELERQTRAFTSAGAQVRMTAALRFRDGETVMLEVEEGRFKVAAGGTLPAGARTPAQALAELRRSLARRSYSSLIRVLSTQSRSALEGDVRSLVTGLEEPDALDVRVTGDMAEVEVPGGHRVTLKREAGIWRIHDFQ